MKITVSDRDVRGADGAEHIKKLARGAAAPPNGEVADLDRRIAALEAAVGMSVSDARIAVESGKVEESVSIMNLLLLSRRRSLITGR